MLRLGAIFPVAAVFPLAAPVASPQSGLIEACAEFVRLETARITLIETIEDENERAPSLEALEVQQEPVFERIIGLRAVTAEDHAARAAAFATMCDGEVFEGIASGCWDRMFAAALVRDMVPRAARRIAAPAPADSHDAELLGLCALAMRLDSGSERDDTAMER